MDKALVKSREAWNKGKLVGQKAPLRLKDIWAIRVRLQLSNQTRDLALFDLAIDSKLRACDLVKLRVRDVSHGDRIAARTIIMQQQTQRPVQFEITEQTREAVAAWIKWQRQDPTCAATEQQLPAKRSLISRAYCQRFDHSKMLRLQRLCEPPRSPRLHAGFQNRSTLAFS